MAKANFIVLTDNLPITIENAMQVYIGGKVVLKFKDSNREYYVKKIHTIIDCTVEPKVQILNVYLEPLKET